jgi:hypothetical protein
VCVSVHSSYKISRKNKWDKNNTQISMQFPSVFRALFKGHYNAASGAYMQKSCKEDKFWELSGDD